MGKSILLALLLLLVSAASPAAGNPSAGPDEGNATLARYNSQPGGGLHAACDQTMYPRFCETLLQPSAGEFADNDPKKMCSAATNAALDKVIFMKPTLDGLGANTTRNERLKTAVMDCVDRLGRSEAGLKAALKECSGATKAAAAKEIAGASDEVSGCMEALQQAEGGAEKAAVGGGDPEATMAAVRQANDTVLACHVAKTFVLMP